MLVLIKQSIIKASSQGLAQQHAHQLLITPQAKRFNHLWQVSQVLVYATGRAGSS